MNDLISREEAIKAVKFYETFCDPYPRVIEALEDLPSVQPEIIRCKDSKYAYMTGDGLVKHCDIWFPNEKLYQDGDYYCADAELRGDSE